MSDNHTVGMTVILAISLLLGALIVSIPGCENRRIITNCVSTVNEYGRTLQVDKELCQQIINKEYGDKK